MDNINYVGIDDFIFIESMKIFLNHCEKENFSQATIEDREEDVVNADMKI